MAEATKTKRSNPWGSPHIHVKAYGRSKSVSLYLWSQHHPKATICDGSLHCFSITSQARNSCLLCPKMDRSAADITHQSISAPREMPELFFAPLMSLRNQTWHKYRGEENQP